MTSLRIAVFGATGQTGIQFIQEALDRGHHVVALVRSPDKVQIQNERLKIKKINIFSESDVSEGVKDCDAVASCLGAPFTLFSDTTFYEDSMKSIISGMRKSNVKRLTCITSWCTVPEGNSLKLFEWFLRPFVLGKLLKSMAVMEKYLKTECTDIDYTVVRPPMLVDGPSSGKKIKAEEGQYISDFTEYIPKTPRRDVAIFMLDCLQEDAWKQKFVAIGL